MPGILEGRRLYAILDASLVAEDRLVAKLRALIAGGADLIQFRAKDKSEAWCVEMLDELYPEIETSKTPFIINDHIELALRYPGAGLHLGQDDLSPAMAREELGAGRILGFSTHSVEQAREAIAWGNILDYFAVGPVYATATKPEYTAVGLSLIQQIALLKPPMPLYAIGGIKRENAADVIDAGASGIVVVSDLLQAENTEAAVRELKKMLPFSPTVHAV